MRMLFGMFLLVAIMLPEPAPAQVEYKRWDEIYRPYTKQLPPGYFDFRDLLPDVQQLRVSGDGAVLCKEWRNAISYGKRIAEGLSPREAVDDIIRDRGGGQRVCGFVQGLVLSPLRIAVRGDDSRPMNAIRIIEWVDQRGTIHYTGDPKNW